MMKRIAIALIWFIPLMGMSQALDGFLVMDYTFDNCSLTDDTGIHDDIITNSLDCVCGINDTGVEFTTDMQALRLPKSINTYLSEDFTLSFYFQVRNTGNPVSLWSLAKNNSIDSMMSIRYLPSLEVLSVQLAESTGTFIEMSTDIDASKCWNHFVLTRQNADYYVYLNGELAAQQGASRPLNFAQDTSVYIASNPGMLASQDVFEGKIDQIKIFNKFAGATDIGELYRRPDQILNPDTTLFLGDNLQINLGPTCASSIIWTPAGDVMNPSDAEPIITPLESTTYIVRLGDSFCSAIDSVRINIINSDSLDCQNLLLPKAFTPNGDGLNDTYFISNDFLVEEVKSFEIYDRIGQKVFETQSKSGEWDGTFKNERLNPGMYLYKITYLCLGEEFSVASNFSLIR